MGIVEPNPNESNSSFHAVLAPFLAQPGLPFSEVLTAEAIQAAFADRGALFAPDDIYSTPIVLWAFLAQTLRDGKGAACAAAVADIATYMQQTGGPVPRGNTGDYCRARAKLSVPALRELTVGAADRLEAHADPSWLYHGLHAKLVDGFTFTMPDTPENQKDFPQLNCQKPGVGFPIARACGALSLATGALCDLAIAPYEGKETGESALLRQLLGCFKPGDLAVFDRCLCSYLMLAILQRAGVQFVANLHVRRPDDFRQGRRLGKDDRLITWTRPTRPEWMSAELYAQIPPTMTLRMVRFRLAVPGRRVESLVVVTSLTDPLAWPKGDIAQIYEYRWNVELDIRVLKHTLHLDQARCKSPDMVRCELWVTLLGYNLIRKLIATAAAVHGRQPRQLGFTRACQEVLSSWMLLATGACRDPGHLWPATLARIAANVVADRPGRIEPRALKRRHDAYPLLHQSRDAWRKKVRGT
jgi:putative transposase